VCFSWANKIFDKTKMHGATVKKIADLMYVTSTQFQLYNL